MSNKQTFKMQLEVDSPLHIGGVEYKFHLRKSDYVLFNKKIHVIDGQKLVDFLQARNLFENYLHFIDRQAKRLNISIFLKEHNLLRLLPGFTKDIIDLEEGGGKNDRVNEILLFVKNAEGQFYIPGSSIKGALMHLLLLNQIEVHYDDLQDFRKEILSLCKNYNHSINSDFKELRKRAGSLVKERLEPYIYQIRQKKEQKTKHAGVSVSDSYAVENLDYSIRQDVDKHLLGEREPSFLPLGREYVLAGSKFFFDLTLDFDILKNLGIECLEDFLLICEKSCIAMGNAIGVKDNYSMILGSNTGFHQKTVLHALFKDRLEQQEVLRKILHKPTKNPKFKKQSEHFNDKRSPRVRNLVYSQDGEHSLAGFVYLTERE